MSRLSTQVTAMALGAVLAALVAVGVSTAGALWVQAMASLDAALLAAAASETHPLEAETWRAERLATPVRLRPWRPDDPLVPAALAEAVRADEQPRWLDTPRSRVLVLVVEPVSAPPGPDGDDVDHPHAVIVAHAPRVTLLGALGPFLVAYTAAALTTAAAVGLLLYVGLRRALRPLEAAVSLLDDLGAGPVDERLEVAGPDEVRQVLAATNALLGRVEQARSTQRRFVADAAHELRTPVTRLLGELDLALRKPRDLDAYRDALARARDHAARLEELVKALLLLARLEAGPSLSDQPPERMSAIVLEALASERATLTGAGCTVQLDVEHDAEVRVHRELWRIAVANLLRNAAVHAAGSTVTVTLESHKDVIVVRVDDDGRGLSDEDLGSALEPFRRGAKAGPGLGLGLALTREVLRHHGGQIALNHGRRGGLAVSLVMPRSAGSTDAARPDRSHPTPMGLQRIPHAASIDP